LQSQNGTETSSTTSTSSSSDGSSRNANGSDSEGSGNRGEDEEETEGMEESEGTAEADRERKKLQELNRKREAALLSRDPSTLRYAYVTLLCDDVMAPGALVLVHSLKRTRTPHDVVVLTMNVSDGTAARLQLLGARVKQIEEAIPYPFPATPNRVAINKPCRYSKLWMWTLTEYHRLVYVDADLLVLSSLDELFCRDELTAAPDTIPPDRFNSGLMVVAPSDDTFRDMLSKVATTKSPNVGDQGFLNNYFSDWYSQGPSHHLPYAFNPLVRLSGWEGWDKFVQPQLRVLHFSGSTKPWNTMEDKQFPTTRSLDHIWLAAHSDMLKALASAMATSKAAGKSGGSSTGARELSGGDAAAGEGDGGVETLGASGEYAPLSSICQEEGATTNGSVRYDGLTVVLTATGSTQQTIQAIRHYASAPVVRDIFVLLSNDSPLATSRDSSTFPLVQGDRPIVLLPLRNPPATARFRPILSLTTAAVLVIEDTMLVPHTLLATSLLRWLEAPNRLLGFLPSAHFRLSKGVLKGRLAVHASLGPGGDYSVVTGALLLHRNYMHYFSCTMREEARRYLEGGSEGDSGGEGGGEGAGGSEGGSGGGSEGGLSNPAARACADVAMNMLVTHLSDLPPLTVYDATQEVQGPFPLPPAPAMGRCLNDLATHMGLMPLKSTIDAVTVMHKDSYIYEPKVRVPPAPLLFSPILNASLPTTLLHLIPRRYRRFLPSLGDSDPRLLSVPGHAAPKHAVCLRVAEESEAAVELSLSEAISSPVTALHLSGTTVFASTPSTTTITSPPNSSTGKEDIANMHKGMDGDGGTGALLGFEDPFAVFHLAARLAAWRRSEGCFAPSRLLLFHGDQLQPALPRVSPWASLLLKATLGDAAFPPFAPPTTTTATATATSTAADASSADTSSSMVCFDRVVLLRDPVLPAAGDDAKQATAAAKPKEQRSGSADGGGGSSGNGDGQIGSSCDSRAAIVRSALRHTCRLQPPVRSSLVILIAGSDASWRQHMPPPLHPANLTAALHKECTRASLPCELGVSRGVEMDKGAAEGMGGEGEEQGGGEGDGKKIY
ncbi:unnamed protein product, partial [Closterium sp. NIES-54]